ncbi:MAG: hypothetical protein EBY80_13140 [Actinobacteria bacterium]|jgi:hypothetical protein|nr:hypothetical protein [Actinomycetota bacterium]NDA78341.1 hypothetical protein [Actinomycetota bacterium]NDD98657.1 hypothetical protein [Actinomycetota bacterium]
MTDILGQEEEVLLTKKGEPRKRKPKTKNNYFTIETEEAILEYRNTPSQAKRNKIYNERIHYGFYKLVENIIHTFKFYYTEVDNIEDLKYEVISFLLQKLDLYDQSKGKAYSYFGTIAKRYLIIYNQKNYKKLVSKADIGDQSDDDSLVNSIIVKEPEPELDKLDIVELFIKHVDDNLLDLFEKTEEMKVADAILEIFKKRENIDIFNKKAVFIYVKEMTDCQSNTITKVIKKLKVIYKTILDNYLENHDY